MPYTALDEYTQWDVDGGTPTWKRMDLVTGGGLLHPADRLHRTGIGGEDHVVYGLMVPTANVEGQLQTFAWSGNEKRAQIDALPAALQVSGGLKDAGICAYRQRSHYINELTLACAGVGEAVTYSVGLVGLTSTDEATPAAAAVLGEITMEWYAGSVKVDTVGYTADSIEASLANNLDARGSLDEGTSSQLRWPDYVKVGNHVVTASINLRTPLGVDLRVDDPETTDYDVVWIMSNGATTKTLTMTTLHPADEPVVLESGDTEILWAVDLEGKYNDLATWTIT